MDTFVLDLLIYWFINIKSWLEYKNLFSPNEYKKEWKNNIKIFSIGTE